CSSSGLHNTEPQFELGLVNDQLKRLLAIDLDHRDSLQVAPQQGLVGIDVALVQDKQVRVPSPELIEMLARLVAQAAALSPVQNHAPHRRAASGRSPVA